MFVLLYSSCCSCKAGWGEQLANWVATEAILLVIWQFVVPANDCVPADSSEVAAATAYFNLGT